MTSNPARILVVDDALLIRGLLKQALHKYGYIVDTASDGQQAIEHFLNYHPDLILMDADMPILDGVSACAKIRELPGAKHLPIIMVTAFLEGQWVDRAYAAGATDYVTKPVNLDVLRNRIHYILQAKRAEEALFEEKEKALVTLASIGDGVITTNAKGNVEFLNFAAAKLTGWTTEEAQGLPLHEIILILDENQQPLEFPIQHCLKQGEMVELKNNIVLVHRHRKEQFAIEDSAAPIKDRNGQIIGVVLVFRDVTKTRKMTQELTYKATHDALTGLYNRLEFQVRVKHLLQTMNQKEHSVHALLYMDLDRFKIVNDTCGHEAGDQLLKDIALLLHRKVEAHRTDTLATLARLGGDEFGLLLENCTEQKAFSMATLMCKGIEAFKFFWQNEQKQKSIFTIGISIGMVPISTQTLNQKSLLAMADAACYAAKNAGRNGVHVYQKNDIALAKNNIQWVSLINDYLEKDQGFALFYQPIIPLTNCSYLKKGTSTRYEILLRMFDEQDQLIPPGAFLSIAKRYNLMSALDRWVLNNVLSWLSTHPEHLEPLDFITINISGFSISDKDFLEMIINDINQNGILAPKLCFEIKETSILTNLSGILNFMTTLKKLGCYLAVDNFGTGMASFACLKNLPVDFVKIDGTLIKNIADDDVDYAMVKAINDIAHLMSLKTIAENVENQATFEKLQELKVDYVQGYWIGEPKPL
jgi:diguanylate cyclase (GGDEF)-like protein/PAS domain S-box-containing protein